VNVQQGGLNGATSERDSATELFTRYSSAIYRYCLRRLRSPEEAEDAVQATYLNAWRSLKRGCAPENPRPWLFQIAANVCADTLRRKFAGTRLELRDPEALEDLVQVEQLEQDAFLDLADAVRDLPDRQRRALVLRDWHGLAYAEIATRMAVSDAAVETLLVRARSRVAATLTNGEWKPKLASSARALILWPLGVLSKKSVVAGKSTVATGSSHLKMGVVLACGTVAPLVAFGVLQTFALEPEKPSAANRTALSAPGTDLELYRPPGEGRLEGRVVVDRRTERQPHAGLTKGRGGSGPKDKPNHGNGHAATPGPVSSAHDAPASPQQVTLCHQTQSDKRPGVTVKVAPQAAEHGLSQDPTGACD
jgi:RNA polymerase sigma-70 factor (ECF subfamily)